MPASLGALMGMRTHLSKSLVLLMVLLLSLAVGCARAEPPSSSSSGSSPVSLAASRSLAFTVDVNVRVRDVTAAAAKIRGEADALGGYVSNGVTSGLGDDASSQIDVRVPKDKLASLRKTIASVGEVVSDSEKVDDLTEQHADLDARLRNARTQEQRLLELMSNKTANIGDLLTTEKELARVRETVERLDAEKRTMDASIDFATVHVSISSMTTPAAQTPGKSIMHAWSAGVNGARTIAVFLAMVAAAVSPTLLPILAFFVLLFFVFRKLLARTHYGRREPTIGARGAP
jgi:Domain of unknown function (DUF4349)